MIGVAALSHGQEVIPDPVRTLVSIVVRLLADWWVLEVDDALLSPFVSLVNFDSLRVDGTVRFENKESYVGFSQMA